MKLLKSLLLPGIKIVLIAILVMMTLTVERKINKLNALNEEYNQKVIIEEREFKQKERLLNHKIKLLERDLKRQVRLTRQLEWEKNEQINNVDAKLANANDRLYQLSQKSAQISRTKCRDSSQTRVKSRPEELQSSIDFESIATQMGKDFRDLSRECSTKYERLKNEYNTLDEYTQQLIVTYDNIMLH